MSSKPPAAQPWLIANRRYLELELERLRLLLKQKIIWLQTQWQADARQGYQGLVISDAEVERLLHVEEPREHEFYARDKRAKQLTSALAKVSEEIAALGRVLADSGGTPAIQVLVRLFRLTPFERDVLLLCLAPELDPAFERLYAYVQDDATRKYATPHLALSLFTSDAHAAAQGRQSLTPDAVLRRLQLLSLEPATGSSLTAGSAPLRLPERVANYLLGTNQLDERVGALLTPLTSTVLSEAHVKLLDQLQRHLEAEGKKGPWPAINVVGPPESGKRAMAFALCEGVGLRPCELDVSALPASGRERYDLFRLIEREAVLSQFGVYFDHQRAGAQPSNLDTNTVVEQLSVFLVLGSSEAWRGDRRLIAAHLPKSDPASQTALWQQALSQVPNSLNGELRSLVQQFEFGPTAIGRIVSAARARAQLQASDPSAQITAHDLWAECKERAGTQLEALAQRIVACHGWDDIVLPGDVMLQLREIAAQVALRPQVYEAWGFGAKLNRGRGISALFAGPSGTGKTLAAEILASHLDLEMYRIDLSGVVSKYIGETEKNLKRVFDAAEQGGAILFFDEADALFGKRSEVKDSHDRYANIEVNYLLQRMEDYRGLAILATNKKSHLDQAFMRRLRFLVDFPFPDAAQRAQIWQTAFPAQAALEQLDYRALGRLEIPGGNIKNIALNAAFLAADQAQSIRMDHVYRAARREYAKIDKLVSETEFGRYVP